MIKIVRGGGRYVSSTTLDRRVFFYLSLASIRVLVKPETNDKSKIFQTLSTVIKTDRYHHLGYTTCLDKNYTLASNKASCFVENINEQSYSFKQFPYSLIPLSSCESPPLILSFIAAPKLSKTCHKLPGIFANTTVEIPGTLQVKDFVVRQNLHSLHFTHEITKMHTSIALEAHRQHELATRTIKTLDHLSTTGITPPLQVLFRIYSPKPLPSAKNYRRKL